MPTNNVISSPACVKNNVKILLECLLFVDAVFMCAFFPYSDNINGSVDVKYEAVQKLSANFKKYLNQFQK